MKVRTKKPYKPRMRKGRSGWTEKRLRQIELEKIAESKARKPLDDLKSVNKMTDKDNQAMAEWLRLNSKYKDRFDSFEKFKKSYDAHYDNEIYLGGNRAQARKSALNAVRNAIKSKAEIDAEKWKKRFKNISKEFWAARKEQGGIGKGRFSWSGFSYLDYTKINGVTYEIYRINSDWVYYYPESPGENDQPRFVYSPMEEGKESADEKMKTKVEETTAPEEVFDDDTPMNQGMADDELNQAILDTFGGMGEADSDVSSDIDDLFNKGKLENYDSVYSEGFGKLKPIPLDGTSGTQKITSKIPPTVSPVKTPGGLSRTESKMKQPEPSSSGSIGLGILGALATIKPTKKRKRKKK